MLLQITFSGIFTSIISNIVFGNQFSCGTIIHQGCLRKLCKPSGPTKTGNPEASDILGFTFQGYPGVPFLVGDLKSFDDIEALKEASLYAQLQCQLWPTHTTAISTLPFYVENGS